MKWKHRENCTNTECFCADDEQSDPICDCGNPAWACMCDKEVSAGIEIDLDYAIKQLKLLQEKVNKEYIVPSVAMDCAKRALDALERIKENTQFSSHN